MLFQGTFYTDEEEIKYRTMADLIRQYAKKYPVDWGATMAYIKAKREYHKNEYGTSGDKNSSLRDVAEIPAHLDKLLKVIDPEYDKGIKFKKFLKRFPMFRTTEKL